MKGWTQRAQPQGLRAYGLWWFAGFFLAGAVMGGCDLSSTEPKLVAVRPSAIYEGGDNSVVLKGSNLVGVDNLSFDGQGSVQRSPSWTVYLNEYPLPAQAISSVHSTEVVVDIPVALGVGRYSVRLLSVEGLSLTCPQPLVVLPREPARAGTAEDLSQSEGLSAGGAVELAHPEPSSCLANCSACQLGQCCQQACGALGCPECPAGCDCIRTCSVDDLCGASCTSGSSCWLHSQGADDTALRCTHAACAQTCNAGSSCSMSCFDGSHCELQTQRTGGSELRCDESSCNYGCTGEASCQLTCQSNAVCALDCADSGSCGLACDASSACLVRCTRAGQCSVVCDDPSDCGDGVFACNRPCP